MKIYTVKSFTDKRKKYTVRHDKEKAQWYCNCLQFLIRPHRGDCKHIIKIKKKYDLI